MGRERPLGVGLGRLKDKEAEAGEMRLLWRIGGIASLLKEDQVEDEESYAALAALDLV